jgi:hypothetical protein
VATYTTEGEFRAYIDAANVSIPENIEALLQRAERRLDSVVGPRDRDADTGLKFDLASLTTPQKGALSRATCAAAEHELMAGITTIVGGDDFILGSEMQVLRRANRVPLRALEELEGFDLLTYSGCAPPTP